MTHADDPATQEDIKRLVDMWRMQDPRHMGLIDKRDLTHLVRVALEHGEISASKAAELLGLSLEEVRALTRHWAKERDDREAHSLLKCAHCQVVTPHETWRIAGEFRGRCRFCGMTQDV